MLRHTSGVIRRIAKTRGLIFIPICRHPIHWVLVIVNVTERTITHYDSLICDEFSYETGNDCIAVKECKRVRAFLLLAIKLSTRRQWTTFYSLKNNVPQQPDGNSCWAFVLSFIDALLRRAHLSSIGANVRNVTSSEANVIRKNIARRVCQFGELGT